MTTTFTAVGYVYNVSLIFVFRSQEQDASAASLIAHRTVIGIRRYAPRGRSTRVHGHGSVLSLRLCLPPCLRVADRGSAIASTVCRQIGDARTEMDMEIPIAKAEAQCTLTSVFAFLPIPVPYSMPWRIPFAVATMT